MLKQLPVALAFAAGLACAAAPAVGGQKTPQHADPAAGQASDVPATWGLMILGFAGAGALLRHERRSRRSGMEATAA